MGTESQGRRRFPWMVVGGVVVFGALLIRAGIAVNGASRIPENPLGLTGFDALAASAVLSAALFVIIVRTVNGNSDRLLATMRQKFPSSPVFLTTVLSETVELVRALVSAPKLKEDRNTVVCLGDYEISWWQGARSPKKRATVTSDEPVVYRVGTLEYVGRDYPALVASVVVDGNAHKIPLFVLSELPRKLMLKGATDEELTAIEDRLQPRS